MPNANWPRYLAGARRAFEARDLRIAIDAACNAAELCVKGLLLLKLDDLPGSHGGLVGKFGELYVKTGLLPGTLGRRLNRRLEARANARYNYAAQITEEMAREVMDLAQEMLAHLEQAEQEIPEPVRRAGSLSGYVVEARYPGLSEPVSREEYEEAVMGAQEVVRWAQGIIERGVRGFEANKAR